MKDHVYHPMPATITELKQKIADAFLSISEEAVKKAVLSMKSRARKLVAIGGRGFEQKF